MAQGRPSKIISMIEWIQTIRLTIKNSLSVRKSAPTATLQLPPHILVVKLMVKLLQIGQYGELTGDGVIYPKYFPTLTLIPEP